MIINSVATSIPFITSMHSDEKESFKTVYNSISELIRYLDEHTVNRIVCTDTGELIEVEELNHVCGILDGLIRRNSWTGEVE